MHNSLSLLSPVTIGDIELKNRVVMAPMTRNRASADGMPNELMVQYYADRAQAGLIVAEGTWPVVTGQAYCRQPGIQSEEQVLAWKKVTDAVHANGGKIVLQVMHAGRIGSNKIKPAGVETVAPSSIQAHGELYTDQAGMQPFDMPRELSTSDVQLVIEEHRVAAENAKLAGFDGVELHCTSGYLPMQFLCSGTNHRTDEFGGSVENRARFAADCLKAMASVFGSGRVGLRMNPGNAFNDTQDDDSAGSHIELLRQIAPLNLAYLHIMRAPVEHIDAFKLAKTHFSGSIILNDNFDSDAANQAISAGQGDAVSFARHFIANPDLVYRIKERIPLTRFDRKTLYTPGEKGYNDYEKAV
ncbi:alkene reductase [Endozoicomonas ascidiicola]|uniref:alkene reductase n=1 Tax=Endozoicomonas ascidiicola TaxID=1698521 RepID=UPI00082ADCB9|nr:alkene reductase [Endozoicomonas ascidiicola]